MKNTFNRFIAVFMCFIMLLTLIPSGFAEYTGSAGYTENLDAGDGDSPEDAPDTPGTPAIPLTYEDLGLEMPSADNEGGIKSSYLNPQTIVITEDNENNSHSGTPDNDINAFLKSTDDAAPIEVRFDIDNLPARSAYLAICSYDCDEDTGSLPEYDAVYVNDVKVGVMTGQTNQWNTTLLAVPVSTLKKGANYVTIHIGHRDIYTGEIIEDSSRWAIEVRWLQLLMDGGNSDLRPDEYSVELTDAYSEDGNICCEASISIKSSKNISYEIEYSLVDMTSEYSSTYMQIIASDFSVIKGSEVNDKGKLALPVKAPSGTYTVQVVLKDYSTGSILATDEHSFRYSTNVVPAFDITDMAVTLSDEEYTNKDITMTVTARADITAGIKNIYCYLDGRSAGRMNMDSQGNLSFDLTITKNGTYTVEICYEKNDTFHSSMIHKTVNNIDREGPVFTFRASKQGAVVSYSDALSGMASASYAVTTSPDVPGAASFNPLPSSGSVITISDDQYLHCTACDKLGNTSSALFIPLRSVDTNHSKITIGAKQSVKTASASFSPANATDKTVTWRSSNTNIVTVSADGAITGVKKGEATVTVTSANGKSADIKVKVVGKDKGVTSIALNTDELSIKDGKSKTLKATVKSKNAADKTVRWVSSDKSVVTVNKNGKVKAVGVGSATVTAYATSGHCASCKVTVKAVKAKKLEISGKKTMKVGKKQTIKVSITPEYISNAALIWTTSDASVATVNKNGKVTGISAGIATITASTTDGSALSASIKITVQGKLIKTLTITGKKKMKVGAVQTLTAVITPEKASFKALKWKTSNSKIASVDANGTVTALKKGEVTITAITRDGSGIKAQFKIKIKK